MTVIETRTDEADLSLTLVAEFDATPDRVWQVWSDPRQLERWWGPPGYPATFTQHDFVPGGQSRYHMTGPDGETPRGWWRIDSLEPPTRIEFANGLAGADGEPVPDLEPMPGVVTFEDLDGRTRMTAVTRFVDVQQMEMMLGMGMREGMALAVGQIDGLLSPVPA